MSIDVVIEKDVVCIELVIFGNGISEFIVVKLNIFYIGIDEGVKVCVVDLVVFEISVIGLDVKVDVVVVNFIFDDFYVREVVYIDVDEVCLCGCEFIVSYYCVCWVSGEKVVYIIIG